MKQETLKTGYRCTEALFLFAVGIYWAYLTQFMTMFSLPLFFSPEANVYHRYLYVLLILSVLKTVLLFLSDACQRRRWLRLLLCALPVSAVWLLLFQKNAVHPYLAGIAILTVGCIGTDYRRILKVYVGAVGAVVFAAAVCSFGAVIPNLVYWSHGRIRSSWGIIYPTDMAAYYLYLCVAAWMAWDRVSDGWMAVPALFGLFVSRTIADSNTGTICFCLFLVILLWFALMKRKENSRPLTGAQRSLDVLSCSAFPFFAILMIALMLAYHAGLPFAAKLNTWNHNRLSLASKAYNNYGIHPLGTVFSMNGAGASTYSFQVYDFVDCSYLQILLRYGWIPLTMLAILWPTISLKAVREYRRRVSVGLALLAFQAISEQRFIELSYNIFLVLPFSILSIRGTEDAETAASAAAEEPTRESKAAAGLTLAAGIVAAALFGRQLLAWFCTLCTVMRTPDPKLLPYQRLIFFFASVAAFAVLCVAAFLVYQMLLSLFRKRRPRAAVTAGLLVCVLVFSAVLIRGDRRIHRAQEVYQPLLETEQAFFDLTQEFEGLSVHVSDLPALYLGAYGENANLGYSFFNGEDLARLHNIAAVVDSELNSRIFQKAGFSYTEISEDHAVYTDSVALAERLTLAGYQPASYFCKELFVDLEALAAANNLTVLEDGGFLLPPNTEVHGPYVDLRAANYRLRFSLTLNQAFLPQAVSPEDAALHLRVCSYFGQSTILERDVLLNEFDESGQLALEITTWIPEAQDVEFILAPLHDAEIELLSESYQIVS